jgi:hypothetical protein
MAQANVQTIKEKGTFWPAVGNRALVTVKAVGHSLFTWSWCKSLLYWLIISGGTMAELAFLIGAIWMSLNATVHPFILMFISEDQTRYLSFLATSAYVALPELIVSLAVIVTIGHIRMYVYNRKNWPEIIWIVLYGLPALFFAGLSAYTIGESVANINFTMPEPFIVARALAGFLFAFTSLLYWQLGKPQEADRLKSKDTERESLKTEKDGKISELETETARLTGLLQSETARLTTQFQAEITRLNSLLDQQRGEMQRTKRQQEELLSAMNKASEDGLQAYGEECIAWLKSGIKSASVPDITRYTGLTTAKVNNAVRRGELKLTPNNKDLILLSSLVPWLQSLAVSARQTDPDMPALRLVNS